MLPDWLDYCPKCVQVYRNCNCSAETTLQDKEDKQDKKMPQCNKTKGQVK